MNILFVCTGNTCRSPLAKALATKILGESYTIDSAGISVLQPSNASQNAILIAQELGLDLSKHLSKQIDTNHLAQYHLILTMSAAHAQALVQLKPDAKECIFSLGSFCGNHQDISDPFGGSLDEYRQCAKQLERLIHLLKEKLVSYS